MQIKILFLLSIIVFDVVNFQPILQVKVGKVVLFFIIVFKGALSGLRQLLATENPLK